MTPKPRNAKVPDAVWVRTCERDGYQGCEFTPRGFRTLACRSCKTTRYVLPPAKEDAGITKLRKDLREARQEARWWSTKYEKVAEGIEKICDVKQKPLSRTSRSPDALLTYVAALGVGCELARRKSSGKGRKRK